MQNARYFTGRFICFYQGSITGRTVTGMGITMNQNVIVAKDISNLIKTDRTKFPSFRI